MNSLTLLHYSTKILFFCYICLYEKDVLPARGISAVAGGLLHGRRPLDHDGRNIYRYGQFLYASLRLRNDGIAVFRVAADGTLSDVGYQLTGAHPRNFNITPDGRFVFVACRDANAIEIYRRSARTGLLKDTGRRISLTKPVFVGWID